MAINDADLLCMSSRWADLESALTGLGADENFPTCHFILRRF